MDQAFAEGFLIGVWGAAAGGQVQGPWVGGWVKRARPVRKVPFFSGESQVFNLEEVGTVPATCSNCSMEGCWSACHYPYRVG